ncbi:DNA methyltransferase [Citricoccus nitrophenolicus]|uniref:DNA methyltransferase n=1 Tax=Citricoccus nitrophenolicus TaxID=863575 RepID=UPI0039B3BAA5
MQEQLDRGRIRSNLAEFSSAWSERIEQWRTSGQGHTEKSFAQQFWSDLMRCFGIIPERIDLFERDAARASTGRTGYIDFFWSGVVIGEAKSLDSDLDIAHAQALDYLTGGSVAQHEWPKFVLVTDFATFRLDRLGEDRWTSGFSLDNIADHVDELIFFAGQETITKREEEEASIQAAGLMAGLFNALVGEDVDVAVSDDAPENAEEEDALTQEASILLTRLLFLLYGDDAGLWESDLFHRWVEIDTTADNLGPQLDALFSVLNSPTNRRKHVPGILGQFPYVNGGIFDGTGRAGFLTAQMRDALLAACRFRWTHISPAVFGAMFQLVKSKQARRGDGEHYTSETNILKTLGPLFLDDYRTRADRLIRNKSTTRKEFLALIEELATNIYVDPACGAGNFLNLAYAQLREIETDILAEMRRRTGSIDLSLDATLDQRLTIDRFYGFEINWWPAKIAETAMFLVDHQANRQMARALGQAPERLPIAITATIIHHDALTLDWGEILPKVPGRTYVFGNPPFLGDHTRTKDQLALMQAAWGEGKQLSRLDFVTSWHALTLRLLSDREGEWAFVTTNSIVMGDQPERLFRPIFEQNWRIKFAHRTFQWDSEAPGKAAVHCVIVGFTRDLSARPSLFEYDHVRADPEARKVSGQINAYLVDGPNVLVAKRSQPLAPNLPEVQYGSKPTDGGNLVVPVEDYERVLADPVMAPYVRPYVGSRELINGQKRWCLWLEDMEPAAPTKSAELKRRLAGVESERLKSKAATTQDWARFPHLFRQRGLVSDVSFVGIPEVSSEARRYLPVGHLEPETIISNKVYGAVDPDGVIFAIASSSMFITWMRTVGGRMKSDLSFSSTITWNNFPLPPLTPIQRKALSAAGEAVLVARDQTPDRSLAQHYAPLGMSRPLVKAHDDLDAEVDKSLGATRRCRTELERQELLFTRFSEMSSESRIGS